MGSCIEYRWRFWETYGKSASKIFLESHRLHRGGCGWESWNICPKNVAYGLQNLRINNKSFTKKLIMIILIIEGIEFAAIHKQLGFQFCSDRAFKRVRIGSTKRLLSLSCVCLSAWTSPTTAGRIFVKFGSGVFYEFKCRKSKFGYNQTKISDTWPDYLIVFYCYQRYKIIFAQHYECNYF